MTAITLLWSAEGLMGLESVGHSGQAAKGEDVVCAAVSSLVHALLLGLSEVAGVEPLECEVEGNIPRILVKWPKDKVRDLDLLTRTIALSLKEIESGYPGYVKVSEVRTA